MATRLLGDSRKENPLDMPMPIGRDLGETAHQLRDWFAKQLPDADGIRIEALRGPKDTGFSSDTLMFELHYRSDQSTGGAVVRDLVLRLEPSSNFLVFPVYDVALQFNMMKALAETNVVVPEMLWLEEDPEPLGKPFFIMERLDGQVPNDSPPYHSSGWIFDLAPEDRTKLWFSGLDAMAEVHKLDWQDPAFACIPRPPEGMTPMQAQLAYWDDYMSWGLDRARNELCEDALSWLTENQLEDEPIGICWGDARISNQIFKNCEPIAVIDWEMVFIGNPVADLAWFMTIDRCFTEGLGLPKLEGMSDRSASIAHWERRTGTTAEHIEYYEVFTAFRFAAIMARVMLQMKHYELMPVDATADVENLASVVLANLLREARQR